MAPLAGLVHLTELRLDEIQIADVAPLAGLVSLKKLSLGGNPIRYTSPLRSLPQKTKIEGVVVRGDGCCTIV